MGKNTNDEFGGYSKIWKNEKDIIAVDGRDGHGS
jgi:hypothetical protein